MKKVIAFLLSFLLIVSSVRIYSAEAASKPEVIHISSAGQFKTFAENCRLDTWSLRKTVILDCDINLSGSGFTPIPSFCGTFDGQGHTIKGVNIIKPYSPAGLFMVVAENGKVKNLSIEGTIGAMESCSDVGGIVGCNYGRISDCSFSGTVAGDENVGAIVGRNELPGTVERCISVGSVTGKSMTGGIAGCNNGAIFRCTNHAAVNISSRDMALEIDNLDFNISKSLSAITSMDTYNLSSDSGGIAGYSDGYIMSCKNNGTVGYPHIGYNLGGIVGRSSGFVSNCQNTGEVLGRKNIGGIAGLAEPYKILKISADKLSQLSTEIDSLTGMINTMIDDAEGSSNIVTGRIDKLEAAGESVSDNAKQLSKSLEEYWNGTVGEVNRASLIFDDTIERLDSISKMMPAISEQITEGINDLGDAVSYTESAVEIGAEGLDRIAEACDLAADAFHMVKGGMDMVCLGLDQMDEGIKVKDNAKIDKAADKILDGLSEEADALSDVSAALNNLSSVMNSASWRNDLVREISDFADLTGQLSTQMSIIADAVTVIDENIDIDAEKSETALDEMTLATEYLNDASKSFGEAMEEASPAFSKISEGMTELAQAYEDANPIAKAAAVKKIANGFAALDSCTSDLADATASAGEGFDHLQKGTEALDEAVEIHDKEAIKDSFDKIEKALKEISEITRKLSVLLKDVAKTVEAMNKWTDSLNSVMTKLTASVAEAADALKDIDRGIQILRENVDMDSGKIDSGIHTINNGIKVLRDSLTEIEAACRKLSEGIDTLGLAADEADKALKEVENAMGHFSRASDGVTEVMKKTESLFDYLNSVEPIQIAPIDTKTELKADGLFDSVNEMLAELDSLNGEVGEESQKLLEDLRQVNYQADTVLQLVIDMIEDVTGTSLKDFHKDTSANNSTSTSYGKLLRCENYGTMYGDLAIGGIVGSMNMYDSDDPENDASISLSSLYHKKYEHKAIVEGCVNRGEVTAKRNNAGGICGEMEVGLISGAESYGTVTSESGNYVGGIAGIASSTIINSYAKCFLGGSKYIGGIIGCASEDSLGDTNLHVENCCAMIEISEGSRFLGSIAGYDEGELINNFFVSDTMAGINRTSYTGRAEPLTFENMLQRSGVPDEFAKFYVKFIADEKTVSTVYFDYGASLSKGMLPVIPFKDGCFANWDSMDYDNLKFNKVVHAVYTPFTTAITGGTKRDNGLSPVYVEGLFDDRAGVRTGVSAYENTAPEGTDECMHIEFDSDGLTQHTVRLLPVDSLLKKLKVYVYESGVWTEKEYKQIGSYVAFDVIGCSADIATVHTTRIPAEVIISVTGAAAVIIVLAVLLTKRKKKIKS